MRQFITDALHLVLLLPLTVALFLFSWRMGVDRRDDDGLTRALCLLLFLIVGGLLLLSR